MWKSSLSCSSRILLCGITNYLFIRHLLKRTRRISSRVLYKSEVGGCMRSLWHRLIYSILQSSWQHFVQKMLRSLCLELRDFVEYAISHDGITVMLLMAFYFAKLYYAVSCSTWGPLPSRRLKLVASVWKKNFWSEVNVSSAIANTSFRKERL